MTNPLVTVEHLSVAYRRQGRLFQAVKEISFTLFPGETVALVGESGSGKSAIGLAMGGLLNGEPHCRLSGKVDWQGVNLLALSREKLRPLRREGWSAIFQDSSSSLNPTLTIETQLVEGLNLPYRGRREFAVGLLRQVEIADPERRVRQYPHELSGGMQQRVAIAMALANRPKWIIADEPTTALDATVQADILLLLQNLQKTHGLTILLITHDLGVVASCCQRVLVLQKGELVESGEVNTVFNSPRHPYTQSLLEDAKSRL